MSMRSQRLLSVTKLFVLLSVLFRVSTVLHTVGDLLREGSCDFRDFLAFLTLSSMATHSTYGNSHQASSSSSAIDSLAIKIGQLEGKVGSLRGHLVGASMSDRPSKIFTCICRLDVSIVWLPYLRLY